MMETSLRSPDGDWSVIYDAQNHQLLLADLQAGTKELLRSPCPPPCCMCWAPDSRGLAVALSGVGLKLFLVALTDGNPLLPCPDPGQSPIVSMAFSAESTSLAIGKSNGEILLLSADRHWVWIAGVHQSAVLVLAWSPDGRYLASASLSGLVILHESESGRSERLEQCPLLVTEIEWPSEKELHIIHMSSLVQIIEPERPLA